MRKNRYLRRSRLTFFILIGPVLWLAVLIWPSVAHSQQEIRRPTHYVIVVRNTSVNVPGAGELISKNDFRTAIDSIPRGLAAASGQIPLWRKPEPGDLISVVFAAAGKDPKPSGQTACESPHHSDPAVSGQRIRLELSTYFDVRARILVEEHDSPSDIADPSSRLREKLLQSLVLKDCDLIANAYSEGLTLAKGLAAVEAGDANGKEKYEQFFLLVFDFASPAYGSTEFNENFDIAHKDLIPGTSAYLIAQIGSLKFADGDWILDLVNYLDYPAGEPGGTGFFERDKRKFYPRLRFYRAVAHEASSDPFYNLADLQNEAARLEENSEANESQVARLGQKIAQLEQQIDELTNPIEEPETNVFIAWSAAATFALLMVLATWRWWAIKGRFRRMVEEFREKQAALEAEKEKQKFVLRNAVCIPDAPNTDQASEFA